MKDYSVQGSSFEDKFGASKKAKTEYATLKMQYSALKKKLEHSDFANAPVALYDELDFLAKMKKVAIKYNLSSELDWIAIREKELVERLPKQENTKTQEQAYYQPQMTLEEKYSKLSKAYATLLKELKNPSYAQTSSAVYDELDLIFKMRQIAQSCQMVGELSWLEPREKELALKADAIRNSDKAQKAEDVNATKSNQEKNETQESLFDTYKLEYIEFLNKTLDPLYEQSQMSLYDEIGLIFKLKKEAQKEKQVQELSWIVSRERALAIEIMQMQENSRKTDELSQLIKESMSVNADANSFRTLKLEYDAWKETLNSLENGNSKTNIYDELTFILKMKQAAQSEKLFDELRIIKKREKELVAIISSFNNPITSRNNKKTQNDTIHTESEPSTRTGNSEQKNTISKREYAALIESCVDENGQLDINAKRLIDACVDNSVDYYQASSYIKETKVDSALINPKFADVIIKLLPTKLTDAEIISYIEGFSTYDDETFNSDIDLEKIDMALNFQKMKLDAASAIKLTNYLKDNVYNLDEIEKTVNKMVKLSVSSETIIKLLGLLGTKSNDTGKKIVPKKALNTVASLKKVLFQTRNNEKNERNNPINLLGVLYFTYDNTTFVMKDGEVTYFSPIQEDEISQTKSKYNDLVSSIENSMLLEFASKYKSKDGNIDTKYLRVATILRNIGIVYDKLFEIVDSSLDKNGQISPNNLAVIEKFKKAGALSTDIPAFLDLSKNEEGKYDEDTINLICDLTSTVIDGKDVCSLIPDLKGNDYLTECIEFCSQFLLDKSNLFEIVKLVKNGNSNIEENAVEVIYDLAQNLYSQDNDYLEDDDFLNQASEIIELSRNTDGIISDDAAGICAVLCTNYEKPETIKKALRLCTDKTGNINPQLAEILWKMGVQKSDFEDIKTTIERCVSADLSVDSNKAQKIINLII